MTLLRPLDFSNPLYLPQQTLKASRRVPLPIGFAVFLATIGFASPVPFSFYVQAALCPLIMAAAFVLTLRDQRVGDIKIDPTLALLCTWSVMSVGWTIASMRGGTLSSAMFVSVILTAFLGPSLVEPTALLRWLTTAMGVILVLVLIHSVVAPGVAYAPAGGEVEGEGLRSFFAAKNTLGQTLIYAVVVRVVIKKGRWRMFANVLLPVLLVLCNNSGAIIASTCVVAAQIAAGWVANERSRGGRGGLFVLGGSMAVAVFTVIVGRNELYALVGRGSDLTGRDVIWKYTFQQAMRQPFFGYGVTGFWKYGGGPAELVRSRSGWAVTSGHQGWLDTMIEYGLVGVVLAFIILVTTIVRVANRLRASDRGIVTLVSAGIVVGLVMGSLSESTLMFPGMPMLALANGLMFNDPVAVADKGAASPPAMALARQE